MNAAITRREVSAALSAKFQRSTSAKTKVRGYSLRSIGWETEQSGNLNVRVFWHADRFTSYEDFTAKLEAITAHLESKGYTVQNLSNILYISK